MFFLKQKIMLLPKLFIPVCLPILFSSFSVHIPASEKPVPQPDSVYVKTMRARLGKTSFYVQKPEDCIENVLQESSVEKVFIISPRNKQYSEFSGNCIIAIDNRYIQRISVQKDETSFRDSIMGRSVTVKEYHKGGEIIRETEFNMNGSFFYFHCSGYSEAELEKYYAVALSFSN